MPEIRKAGKLGLIHRELPTEMGMLKDYLVNPLPPAPATVTWPSGLQQCGMLGNDTYGDCTIAGSVHLRMLCAAIAQEAETMPVAQAVVAWYLAFTGGQDSGCVEADVLKAWQTQGICGNKIAAFAPLDISDDAELRSAVALFGGSKVDINVPGNAMDQFNAGQPWHLDNTPADNQDQGGHSIVRCGYRIDAVWGPVWALLTWGTVQLATDAWMVKNCVQDWAVLTNEFVTANPGLVDVAALQADIKKLAG